MRKATKGRFTTAQLEVLKFVDGKSNLPKPRHSNRILYKRHEMAILQLKKKGFIEDGPNDTLRRKIGKTTSPIPMKTTVVTIGSVEFTKEDLQLIAHDLGEAMISSPNNEAMWNRRSTLMRKTSLLLKK